VQSYLDVALRFFERRRNLEKHSSSSFSPNTVSCYVVSSVALLGRIKIEKKTNENAASCCFSGL